MHLRMIAGKPITSLPNAFTPTCIRKLTRWCTGPSAACSNGAQKPTEYLLMVRSAPNGAMRNVEVKFV